ncbi:unnamed protein product [Caenorhabditis bovis]|uniref:Uncharacterized protein n=1 Tax=Caenorhabditis bovis TaxID=2654633 RepID=A0A8S1F1I0_9PELO|nr:unnamed protein product [Caenorhabditis bovis]
MKRSRLTREENDARIRGYGVRLLPVENVNDGIEEETEEEFAGNFADAGCDDWILDHLFTEGCDYNGTDETMEMLPKDNVFSVYQEWNNGGERLSAAEYDYYKGIDLELAILNNIRSCFIRKELDIGKTGLVLLNLAAKIGRTEEEGKENFGKLIEDVNDFVRLVQDKMQRLLRAMNKTRLQAVEQFAAKWLNDLIFL